MAYIMSRYHDRLVAEIVVRPNVAYIAGRIFTYEPDTDDGSVFTSNTCGDKVHVSEQDGRLIVTRWVSATGNSSVSLITGTDGSAAYCTASGRWMSVFELGESIFAIGQNSAA